MTRKSEQKYLSINQLCTFKIIWWVLDFCENISHWNNTSKYRTSGKSEGCGDIEKRETKPEESERSVELKAVIFWLILWNANDIRLARSIEEVSFSFLLILQSLRTTFNDYATNKKVENMDSDLKVQCSTYELSGLSECFCYVVKPCYAAKCNNRRKM